jgi:hypothetical protein
LDKKPPIRIVGEKAIQMEDQNLWAIQNADIIGFGDSERIRLQLRVAQSAPPPWLKQIADAGYASFFSIYSSKGQSPMTALLSPGPTAHVGRDIW